MSRKKEEEYIPKAFRKNKKLEETDKENKKKSKKKNKKSKKQNKKKN